MPVIAAMMGANLIGSIFNRDSQRETNWMNAQMVDQQENFQERMSDTAHQREVGDLEKAGLNPILSAGGGGSSTPAGATAQMTSPNASIGAGISHGMDTAIALRGQNATLENMDMQNDNLEAKTETEGTQQALNNAMAGSTAIEIQNKKLTNKLLSDTLPAQIKKANAEGNYAELNQLAGLLNSGASSASSLLNIPNMLKGFKKAPTKTPIGIAP